MTLVLAVLAAAVLAPSPSPTPAAARRPITETDLYRFVWVADPQISPDGREVAFVRVTVNKKKDGYDTALWIAPTDGSSAPRAFTAGPRDSGPVWSPDGKRLAFVRATEKDGKPQPGQVHVIDRAGGEARALTDLPKGGSSPAWSPDGRTIAFTSTTNAKDLERKKRAAAGAKDEEPESDVRVITRAVYRFNGRGYLDETRPSHIWTVPVPEGTAAAGEPRQVTRGEFEEGAPAWSADGGRILFVSVRTKEPYYEPSDSDVYVVPAAGGDIQRLASIDGSISGIELSPDGKSLAFRGTSRATPVRSYDQPDLYVAGLDGTGAPRNVTAGLDTDVASGLTGDQRAPRGGGGTAVAWSADGKSLFAVVAEQGRANLRRIDVATGKDSAVTRGDQEVMAFSVTPDGRRATFVLSSPTRLGDLFVADLAAAGLPAPRQLTRFNDALFAELRLTEPVEVWHTTFDGKKIHALVQRPPDFAEGKTYPLILNIHGGPHAAYGYTFFHEMQWMAAKGYVVLYPNPRGSTSYGQDFGNVIQHAYPGDDHKDLMAGVDELIRRGWVDPGRLGVTGGSGGGVLTNWAITQTDRFKAAVSQRSIADWAAFWYTADFTLFQPTWFKGAPWQDPKDFAARSAITFADRIKTPLMLVEGEEDWRTPASAGGEQMFRALKFLKKPVVMVRFPGENHDLSRSGQPRHRVERLQHIVGWFDRYLMGRDEGKYDVPASGS
ncbi:MAG TPA: S9 family peptidase [Vicinamibacteria bacterium]|nr:S9 family peptidase [Vicinamibacteria bacterium]